MTTIKTPVRYIIRWADGNLHGGHFEDADGNLVKNDDIAAALNATANVPDLTALREAVEEYRDMPDWARSYYRTAEAAFDLFPDLFPKDGTP